MNIYEAMYIIDPKLGEDELDGEIQVILDGIKENGGEIISTKNLGKRDLAYSIKKSQEGAYFLVYFKLADGKVLDSIKDKYKLDTKILRYMILRNKQEQVPEPQKEIELEPAHKE